MLTAVALLVAGLTLACAGSGQAFRLTGNVALKAVTHQSVDLLNGNTAYAAVDGNRASDLANKSCTNISAKRSPWWRATLERPYRIAMISITNRGDCCAEQINGAEIRVGNSLDNDGNHNLLVAKVFSVRPGRTRKFRFSPAEGQYVSVVLPGEDRVLTLCEVEVFALAEDVQTQTQLVNVALGGRATQSSVSHETAPCLSLAQNAIDGNRQFDPLKGSCAQTDMESAPWWRLDLLRSVAVTAVALTSRGDEQLNGAEIHIGDSLESEGRANPLCVSVSFIPAGGTTTLRCAAALQGRFVTVSLRGENRTLSLCEVEVFGLPEE